MKSKCLRLWTHRRSTCVLLKADEGQALVTAALALTVLLGFTGLAVDMGVLRYEKRLQQTAADAAAIAGASNLPFGGVASGAQNASASNGFTDNGGGQVNNCTSSTTVGTVCVEINNPPLSGPHTGDSNYVEALVAAVHPTYFMRVLGVNSKSVTARAVATIRGGGPEGACLYTLGPPTDEIQGVNINGSATLDGPSCGIVDNGNFNTKGNKLVVNAGTFGVSGDWERAGPGGTVTCTGSATCPTVDMPAVSDPLSKLTPPCSSCPGGTSISINGDGNYTGSGVTYSNGVYTVSPGTYTSISISGTGSGNTVVFSPGTYIFNGGGNLTIPGNANISGAGVTFYFTNTATISVNGTPHIELTAPTSGTYEGILMYQDPNDTNVGPFPNGPTISGNSGSFYNGTLYFPSAQLTFSGDSQGYDVAIVIVKSLALSGNPTVHLKGSAGMPSGPIIETAVLVE